jgi:hypothetical protein
VLNVGDRVRDIKYNRTGTITSIKYNELSIDYCIEVHYDNGQWGNYYRKHMFERFEQIESDLIRVDFVNKRRLA